MDDSSDSTATPLRATVWTTTQLDQLATEKRVAEIYEILNGVSPRTRSLMLELWKERHLEYLMDGLMRLSPSHQVLDANRPWLCYWILHSITLLGGNIGSDVEDRIINFLSRCQDKNGGYCGGPGQLPHLATTYAAVNTLLTLGSEKAFSSINRDTLYGFLLKRKDPSGSYRMHDGGEMDVRACYTVLSVASCLNLLDEKLVDNVGNYILSCQTYEGGIAGEPGSEAHGGYTFCGLAAMILIDEVNKLDLPRLIDWVAFRQGVECGFQGRTNKLVDGCYSFWQGGIFAFIQKIIPIVDQQSESLYATKSAKDINLCSNKHEGQLSNIGMTFISKQTDCDPLFQSIALQQYIILCSQVLEGGFKDKPGKSRDYYHSCYCLSGLSVCQYSWVKDIGCLPLPNAVLGPFSNLLESTHPLHNIVLNKYFKAYEFFSRSSLQH